jgi:hypothetical protein
MSAKEFEALFNNLNTVFIDLHSKIDVIINKYEDLEKQLKRHKKSTFKCRKCFKKFENLKELQKHKNEDCSCKGNFKCDVCDKSFKSESQLNLHIKKHGKFECEECDREYKIEGLLEKHVEVVHGSMKIFCHYLNNDRDCPFEDQCIFAHEDSPECKFGTECERMMCMFQHEERDISDNEEENENEDESDEEIGDEEIGDVKKDEKDLVKITDLEPSLKKVEEAMNKVNILLQTKKILLKCDICDFEAKNANGLTNHKRAKHNDNSK